MIPMLFVGLFERVLLRNFFILKCLILILLANVQAGEDDGYGQLDDSSFDDPEEAVILLNGIFIIEKNNTESLFRAL